MLFLLADGMSHSKLANLTPNLCRSHYFGHFKVERSGYIGHYTNQFTILLYDIQCSSVADRTN